MHVRPCTYIFVSLCRVACHQVLQTRENSRRRRERERKGQTEQEREEKYRVRICGLVCESRGHLLFFMCLPMIVTLTYVLLSKAKMPDTFVH